MPHKVLITGASGYLGGTLLHRLTSTISSSEHKFYALVRTDSQAESVKKYGAEPITFNTKDEAEVRQTILDNGINIVFWLIDALDPTGPVNFIKALGELKKATGQDVHFLHTTGAKLFSSHVGAPTDRPLYDDDPKLYEVQKTQRSVFPPMQTCVDTNNTVIETGESLGVHSYVFAPCIVYGKGEGFGNPISIQTVAIVEAAKGTGKVYKVDEGRPTWPVCHVSDTAALYETILMTILAGKDPGHGKNGYFLAASGSVAWDDIYSSMAKALHSRGAIKDASVDPADDAALEMMGTALKVPIVFVAVQLGGNCTFTARHGEKIGWKPQYKAEHIFEALDDEVALILEETKKRESKA